MKLHEIQQKLKAPKSQFNAFGKYHYRNCEDILEALKPLLGTSELVLTDKIVQIGDRYYVEATAMFQEENKPGKVVAVTAYARESDDKKGMDAAQITGAASSYARKYALNGLFLIDDTKDADSDEKSQGTPATAPESPKTAPRATKSADPHIKTKQRIVELIKELGHEFDKTTFPDLIAKLTGLELVEEAYPEIVERLRDLAEAEHSKN